MPRPTKATDQMIQERILQGKTYTDIVAEYRVSPTRISVIKKRMRYKKLIE